MKWSLLELNRYQGTQLEISEKFEILGALKKRQVELIDASPVEVTGFLVVNRHDYILQLNLKIELTMPSTRSLEPVTFMLDFNISETFMSEREYEAQLEKTGVGDEEVIVLEKDIIDLREVVEDYIILAIPTQILSAEEAAAKELPAGQDWEIIREDDFKERKAHRQEDKIDPRLAKLSALLDNEKE